MQADSLGSRHGEIFTPLRRYNSGAKGFHSINLSFNRYIDKKICAGINPMLRLIIIFVLAIAVGLFISRLFSSKRDDSVIDGEVIDAGMEPKKPSLFAILLLGILLAGVFFFVLPRFGVSVMGLLQKAIAFLPLVRGFLPF